MLQPENKLAQHAYQAIVWKTPVLYRTPTIKLQTLQQFEGMLPHLFQVNINKLHNRLRHTGPPELVSYERMGEAAIKKTKKTCTLKF